MVYQSVKYCQLGHCTQIWHAGAPQLKWTHHGMRLAVHVLLWHCTFYISSSHAYMSYGIHFHSILLTCAVDCQHMLYYSTDRLVIIYMQENWVKVTCEKHGKHGPDGWKELTLEQRKRSLLDLWKEDQEKVRKDYTVCEVWLDHNILNPLEMCMFTFNVMMKLCLSETTLPRLK